MSTSLTLAEKEPPPSLPVVVGRQREEPTPASWPEVDQDYGAAARIGQLIIILCFGVLGGWASLAELESAAVAPGVLVVESYRKTIQHLEGGIVRQINVREGDRVSEGDILVRLEDTRARAEMEVVRGRLYSALAHEARLIAERDHLPAIEWPLLLSAAGGEGSSTVTPAAASRGSLLLSTTGSSVTAGSGPDAGDPRANEAMSIQSQAFKARRAAIEGEIQILRQRIRQLESKIEGLEAVGKSRQVLEASYREEAQDMRELYEKKFSDRPRLRQLERQAAEAAGDAGENLALLASAHLEIGEAKQQILQITKEFQAEVVEELKVVQAEAFDLRERLRSLEDTVDRTVIRAPVNGTVMGLGIHTVGGVIQAATPVLDIVPEGEPLVIEAQVSLNDIDKVTTGLLADIRFSAFSFRTTPVIQGEVITVTADRVEEQNGSAYYRVRVRVLPDELSKIPELTLLPGMPADVMIKTGSRTLLSYLIQPLKDAIARSFNED